MSTGTHAMESPLLGIDLGTTNSLIAVWREGRAELIPNALGEVLTPSAVSLDEDGSILVGSAARARLTTHPLRSVAAFKRYMGSDKRFTLGDRQFTPEELSALVLGSLKADAEAHLGMPVSTAVISVPAYFSDEQRKRTVFAAELAGLRVERLINEPTAAAMAYGLHEQQFERTLIFDLGGGTFDVTVLEYALPLIEVHASTGDNFLGVKISPKPCSGPAWTIGNWRAARWTARRWRAWKMPWSNSSGASPTVRRRWTGWAASGSWTRRGPCRSGRRC